jgi:prepilin-type N-terminal cleavage/methylation domain-containing protein/prepilin-type processing-associated H-X9-DG protein
VSRKKGFTLVELLVVVAIIALLVAILMPALTAARESARRTQCASNMHTLAIGVMLYSQANHNAFPGIATDPQQPTDWIYFSTWEGQPYATFANGRLYPYIKNESVYRCPSDDCQLRVYAAQGSDYILGPYRYSYAINSMSASIARYACCVITDQARINGVKRASEKILFIEGNPQTMIDGCWVPPPSIGSALNDMGDRHDRGSRIQGTGRANVVFLDGHVDFVDATFAHDPMHWMPVP